MSSPPDVPAAALTTAVLDDGARPLLRVPRIRLEVVDGPDRGQIHESTSDRITVGSHELNDLVLKDGWVSRFHCEILMEAAGPRLRDLDSRNGTVVDGLVARDVYLRDGSQLRLGTTAIRFSSTSSVNDLPVSDRLQFGPLLGRSVAMRRAFALLERAAGADSTVLLEGETGTGKEGAAAAIHEASRRSTKPFVIVDCGSMPAELLESELFGHEKGAFTGAFERRIGAFAEASGGTVFLDEIGELPLEVQPKLLRVLDTRQIRRVGSNSFQPVDVRVVAATNRDLRGEVNAGRFRADLYYRLAVLRVRLPPLRERTEDIDVLVPALLSGLAADASTIARLTAPAFCTNLKQSTWSGNVRELRNHLERCLAFDTAEPLEHDALSNAPLTSHGTLPYEQARRRALDDWERSYASAVLQASGGDVERAAQSAGISRASMYRLVSRHKLLGKFRPG